MTSPKNVTNALALELIGVHSIEKILCLTLSTFGLFQEVFHYCSVGINKWDEKPVGNDFGLVIADLPLGMNASEWQTEDGKSKIRIQKNWIKILQSLEFLSNQGIGLFVVEPNALGSKRGESFRAEIGRLGFQIKAVFSAPAKILAPDTSIQPIIILISRDRTDKIFIAELFDTDQVRVIINNFTNNINTDHLSSGIIVNDSEFKSFYHFKISRQIELLETQYKVYSRYKLADVAVEINSVGSGIKFEERENAIYLPKLGKSAVISNLKEAKLRHHNYYQVILNNKIVKCEYAVLFFSSALGKLVLESLSAQTFIPHVNKSEVSDAIIAIPELNEQEVIIGTHQKLSELKSEIDNFEQELALNPTSALKIQDQITGLLDSLGTLTEADRIRALIRAGESKIVEFKETLSLDVKTQSREKYIEVSALKTVVAFLNSEGGSLLVGVVDNGEIRGLAEEIRKFYKKSNDNFKLHFVNLLKNRIGSQFYPCIDHKLVHIDEKDILVVTCKPSQEECFLDGSDFYVRTNPATEKLEGKKLVDYIRQRKSQWGDYSF